MMTHRWTSPQRPARVVVLGATGFVGRDAAREMSAQGIETVPLGSADVDLCAPESVDALRRLVRRDDALVITSALTPDKGKDAGTLMRNLTMGEHLSRVLEGSPCAQVVYVSSDAVYADDVNPVRETSCASPATFHGLMHLCRERMLAQALRAAGTPLAVLRPCALYGPDDTHQAYGPNRFLRTALQDRTISLFGQGEEKRDHVFIEDLSRLVALCLAHRSEGVLNVATGRSVSFAGLAAQIARLSEAPVRIESRPRQEPVTHRHFDVTGLVRAFPSFRVRSVSDGLAETFGRLARAVERHA